MKLNWANTKQMYMCIYPSTIYYIMYMDICNIKYYMDNMVNI